MKDKIRAMSLVDKITLLSRIKKNYSYHGHFWTHEKVTWLDGIIRSEINLLSEFEI